MMGASATATRSSHISMVFYFTEVMAARVAVAQTLRRNVTKG
jgi:hypothetical protein